MINIAHIINPVKVNPDSDLYFAQPVTFNTMQIAKAYQCPQINVDLFSAQYKEDREVVPDNFRKTLDLKESVCDYNKFDIAKKLPRVKDILDRLYSESDSEYFVYSNVDIALMPYFYAYIYRMIESGFDGIVVNRRTISEKFINVSDLPRMFAQMGERHPGHDCFIFKRDHYRKFNLGNSCIGANWIGKILIANIICHANKFVEVDDLHLTFHIGDRRSWKNTKFSDYDLHNEKILKNYLLNLMDNEKVCRNEIIKKQMIRLGIVKSVDLQERNIFKRIIKKLR